MNDEVNIPDLPYQASVIGQIANFGVDRPPLWIEVVQEVQRWS